MEMKAITVYVPDNGCKGCDFLSYSYDESCYMSYQERCYCTIFKCDIEKNKSVWRVKCSLTQPRKAVSRNESIRYKNWRILSCKR